MQAAPASLSSLLPPSVRPGPAFHMGSCPLSLVTSCLPQHRVPPDLGPHFAWVLRTPQPGQGQLAPSSARHRPVIYSTCSDHGFLACLPWGGGRGLGPLCLCPLGPHSWTTSSGRGGRVSYEACWNFGLRETNAEVKTPASGGVPSHALVAPAPRAFANSQTLSLSEPSTLR